MEVQEAAASGVALGEVGSSWTNVLYRHNHNTRLRVVLLSLLILHYLSCRPLPPELLLLLHYRLLSNRSGLNPLLLMHGLNYL